MDIPILNVTAISIAWIVTSYFIAWDLLYRTMKRKHPQDFQEDYATNWKARWWKRYETASRPIQLLLRVRIIINWLAIVGACIILLIMILGLF